MTRTFILNAVVAVIAAAAGFGLYKLFIAPVTHTTTVAPAARPDPQPDPSSDAAPDAKPDAPPSVDVLPDFTLTDRAGRAVSIRSWPNQSLIVNFWATWCAPCRKEIPLLMATQKARAQEGFQVVGIAVDEREAVLKYADKIALDYPLLIGEQDALDAMMSFGIAAAAFPITVFTDNQGRIVVVYPGELTQQKLDVLLNAVGRVNRGEQTPSQARIAASEQLDRH